MKPYLSASDLTLQRGDSRICEQRSMLLLPGECVHLAGGNGSGKTTLMRALCGLLRPEAGAIDWHGGSPRTHAHYCAHQDGLKDAWTVAENLQWTLRMHGCTVPAATWNACLGEMRLDALADTRVAQLSQGEKRRTALAKLGLIQRPVWLLDEPFDTLDSASRGRIVEWITGHTAGGGAVLFSSHSDRPASLRLSRTISMDAPS